MHQVGVFLGGTCNGSQWRELLIEHLSVPYFNPVVDAWTRDDEEQEIIARRHATICVYGITPKMVGVYAIAELMDDCHRRPQATVMLLLAEDDGKRFDPTMAKSLEAVTRLVERTGVPIFRDVFSCAEFVNVRVTAQDREEWE